MRLKGLGATGLALALVLGLAACGDEDIDEATGAGGQGGAATSSETTPETNSAEAPSSAEEGAAPTPTPNQAPGQGSAAEKESDDNGSSNPGELELAVDYSDPSQCIIGDWIADQGYFKLLSNQLGEEGRLVSVDGEVNINYSGEGIITTYYDQWRLVYEVEGHTAEILRDGIDSGQYHINDDGTLDFWETNVGSVITTTVAGMVMPVEAEAQDQSNLPIDCSEKNMTIIADANPVKMFRE